LASCSDDKTIKIYDLRNNELLQHYNAHAGAVNMIDFHPSGFYMGSVSNDSKVKIWDLRKGSALFSLYGHSGPVQSIRFSNAGDFFSTGGDDKMLLVWKTNFFKSKTIEQNCITYKK
jgi:centriolar protein POC1